MKLKDIFSIKNEYGYCNSHKVINICGLKIKLRRKNKGLQYAKDSSLKTYSYTTVHYVIAMLKAYGIKNIITSPGTQNSVFNITVQNDDFFKCFSVVDERSAVYTATGLANETGEPVVITCTGATASRNYMSGLTEAFYRKLPVIAMTFFNYGSNPHILAPQFVDRRVSQNDIKTIDVELPRIFDRLDKTKCLTFLNAALATAKYKHEPVHINCPSVLDFRIINAIKDLPEDIWSTDCYYDNFEHLKSELKKKKIAIFIGEHKKFDKETQDAISNFAKSYCAPVFCDHTSNYKGKNKILIAQAKIISKIETKADIVIDLGGICGDYSHFAILANSEIWRINEDAKFKFRDGYSVKHTFMCKEKTFFEKMNDFNICINSYYDEIKKHIGNIELPQDIAFATPFIAYNLTKKLPKNCSLHVSILNSLRGINFFDIDNSIDVTCNVGGFGIDGAVSSLVGQSFNNRDKKCFGIIGDLAFFYDMNAIGNRDIKNNLRILLINNNRGVEFSMPYYTPILDKTSLHVAAEGHFKGGAKGWAKSCGFEYFNANSKDEFLNKIDDFCNKEFDKPVFFEVFTTNEDEMTAYNTMKTIKQKGEQK